MKLLGRNRLQALFGLDEQIDKWLVSWMSEMSHANWKHANDVRQQFPQAKCVAETIFQFRVGPHTQYIEVAMMYPLSVAVITDLKYIN
ncbi:type II toxin-antitoxin system HigB family toxin [Herminiimonas arsenitoxidans]|uniref:type II toxin-antitoxin system HigB family toxin n=1 Tax=Herminiimonas arsenitoxidans TaxID=1809410 RepID=UPI0009702389